MVRFEKERTGLVHQETVKDLRHLQLEQEKLYKKVGSHPNPCLQTFTLETGSSPPKFPLFMASRILLTVQVELLTQELHATETDKGLEVKQLEAELQGTRQQLLGYEKIEKELDEIVMQSAQSKWWG